MNDLAQLLELMKHDPDAFQGLKIFRFVNYASLLNWTARTAASEWGMSPSYPKIAV
jgi:hypothetical protein